MDAIYGFVTAIPFELVTAIRAMDCVMTIVAMDCVMRTTLGCLPL